MKGKVEKGEIQVRMGIADFIYSKEEYDNNAMPGIPEGAYFIGYEDDEGRECDEEGNYLNQDEE